MSTDQQDPPAAGRRRKPEQTPVQRALGLLVRREHSRRELTRKLTARGVEAEAATAAVERLAGEGWQDDTRFAESLLRSRAGSGYGPLYIRAELGTHGLAGELVAATLQGYDGDWTENARELLRRRFGEDGPVDLAQRRKAADLLARRGFDGDSIRRASRFDPDD
ncbi:recombination regulator RecX [Xanthomonas sp. XNM01]|uniref:recombination regulator RecX n=1 Tax=Xanthomonas sp. XNM01 TaxID=2769289 RepID=UPI00177C91D9|nr:recombination regulator RecX [Xanthomonas sp. XNM01]MBD9367658.1 recombination regulator RecX [Xanthomonas sp. XNM01]